MSIRSTLLFASAAIALVSVPAAAQDDRYASVAHHEVEIEHHGMDHGGMDHGGVDHGGMEHHRVEAGGDYDGEWQGDWIADDTYEGEWNGTYTENSAQGRHRDPRHLGASPDGRLAYTLAEREAWLSDCRLLMADGGGFDDDRYYNDRHDGGGLIGGLLGAVVGGVAGNRIGGRGDRLAGTLIGAGVGGIAGAVIGSVVDSASDGRGGGDRGELDRNEIWAAQYCDAYLRRYEMGGGTWGQTQQIMVVPVAQSARHNHGRGENCRTCREVVTEEWVEIERPAPRPRPRPTPRPAPQPRGKLTPIN